MRILVDISIEYYEQMLNRVAENSHVHSILMNGVVVHDYQTGVRRRVVKSCVTAEILRDATETPSQEALPEMEQSIKLSHEIQHAVRQNKAGSPLATERNQAGGS